MRSIRSRSCASAAWSSVKAQRFRGRSKEVVIGVTTGASLPAENETKVTQGQ